MIDKGPGVVAFDFICFYPDDFRAEILGIWDFAWRAFLLRCCGGRQGEEQAGEVEAA